MNFDRRQRDVEEFGPASGAVDSEWGSYLPVHPFADEAELLVRLGMVSDDCQSVDAWWCTGDDVFFLQVEAVGPNDKLGYYVSGYDQTVARLRFVAKVDAAAITRSLFESVMRVFTVSNALGFDPSSYGESLVLIQGE